MQNPPEAEFTERFNDLCRRACVSDGWVTRQFGVSRPIVDAWHAGRLAPHPILQPIVLDWLEAFGAERAKAKLQEAAVAFAAVPEHQELLKRLADHD
jgi:hypothetical protein